ncbi:MAG: polyphosphate kinase 1 [Verrucomicrobium sp.]|jgi:polyphosphate kinase|nr:polyphosphate kinase 1 [Verrucomicrobium sp.]
MARRRPPQVPVGPGSAPEVPDPLERSPGGSGALPLFNRELSWLEFNQRVLDEARDPSVPLLERVKFLGITHSNLDEFFEVRVAGLKQQIESEALQRTPDGLTAGECLRVVTRRVRDLVREADRCWSMELRPALEAKGFRLLRPEDLDEADRRWLAAYHRDKVHPVLTPLAVDPSHPFPQLLNKSLNLITRLVTPGGRDPGVSRLAIVQVPRVLPHLVRIPRPDGRWDAVLMSDLIGANLAGLFGVDHVGPWWSFRVTRNSELYIDEEEVSNLRLAVETELHNRRKGEAVRLEVSSDCPEGIRHELLATLGLGPHDLYAIDGPIAPARLMAMLEGDHAPELRDVPFVAPLPPGLREGMDVFESIRGGDLLLHHPYESFDGVLRFLQQAAVDPRVLAIKQTLYRTGGDRRIVGALMDAVKNGKQVTVVVELKARFDEANNIAWSRRLEEAGVHVVYGVVGYKVHAKVCLVVRRDDDGLRRYVHLGTGNYNPSTARLYTDLSLLTCRPDLGEDATTLFNLLTGVCQHRPTRRLVLAPFELHDRVQVLIRREAEHARAGLPARIVAKMNALVDEETIRSLCEASQAGVEVDLIIRGICCLRPGVPGLSERIRVRSIIDRFLEHSRVWSFHNAGNPAVFVTSADWMPRNFFKRLEVAFPILDGRLRDRVLHEILEESLGDTAKVRLLQPDGTHVRPPQSGKPGARRSQSRFMDLARASSRAGSAGKTGPAPSAGGRAATPRLRPGPRPG